MDLFEYMRNTTKEKESPLAARLRPVTLEDVVGQEHIIGKDKFYYFLWTSRNRKNYSCKGNRQYYKCRV